MLRNPWGNLLWGLLEEFLEEQFLKESFDGLFKKSSEKFS